MRGDKDVRNHVEASRLVRDTVEYEWEGTPDGGMKRVPVSGNKIIDEDGTIKIENFTYKRSEVHSGCGHPLGIRRSNKELAVSGGVCQVCNKEYCENCFAGQCAADKCHRNMCPGCVRFLDFEGITALLCPDCHAMAYTALIEEAKRIQGLHAAPPPEPHTCPQPQTVYVPVYQNSGLGEAFVDIIKAPFKFIRNLFWGS